MTNGYDQTYAPSEVSEVSVDILMLIFIGVANFATLVGLMLLFGWAKKRLGRG